METFGMKKELRSTYDAALAKIPDVLKTEGFGILTRIDVRKTLDEKLGVKFRRYEILGACNPEIANKALAMSLDAGVMMPCNVVVWEGDDGRAVVEAVDPMKTPAASAGGEFEKLVATVREKLARCLGRME